MNTLPYDFETQVRESQEELYSPSFGGGKASVADEIVWDELDDHVKAAVLRLILMKRDMKRDTIKVKRLG